MDFLKKQLQGATHGGQQQSETKTESSGGLMGKVNNALGGGQTGEKKEGEHDCSCICDCESMT